MKSIAEIEIERHQWGKLRCCQGLGSHFPASLKELINASTNEALETAYWKIENSAVVQGQLFESAEYVVSVLMAALLDDRNFSAKIDILELIYQIVSGDPHEDEVKLGNIELGNRCREKAREGLWLFYKELQHPVTFRIAHEILEIIDADLSRVETYTELLKK